MADINKNAQDLLGNVTPTDRVRTTGRGTEFLDDSGKWQTVDNPSTQISEDVVRSRRTRGAKEPQIFEYAFTRIYAQAPEEIKQYVRRDESGRIVPITDKIVPDSLNRAVRYSSHLFYVYSSRLQKFIYVDTYQGEFGQYSMPYVSFDGSGALYADILVVDNDSLAYTPYSYEITGGKAVKLDQCKSIRKPFMKSYSSPTDASRSFNALPSLDRLLICASLTYLPRQKRLQFFTPLNYLNEKGTQFSGSSIVNFSGISDVFADNILYTSLAVVSVPDPAKNIPASVGSIPSLGSYQIQSKLARLEGVIKTPQVPDILDLPYLPNELPSVVVLAR